MPSMDIFNSDAFNMVSLTHAINHAPYVPNFLGSLGLFEAKPVMTEVVAIENRNSVLSLIQTSPRGTAPESRVEDRRAIRDVRTVRIAKDDTIYASQIQNLRAFGSESELATVAGEWARRTGSLARDVELTWEHQRLGAVQGIVTDADGSVLFDWYDLWGVTQPAEIDFELDDDTTDVRAKCASVVRATNRAAGGSVGMGVEIIALAGDQFWDTLVHHPDVRTTYLNQPEANRLREGTAFEQLRFGGISFINYRGTDDTSTVAIESTKCKFFPAGARDMFGVAFAPGESLDAVNTMGQPLYNLMVRDPERNFWVKSELYSYPLFMCLKPLCLQRARVA